jgi:hypothetical protein
MSGKYLVNKNKRRQGPYKLLLLLASLMVVEKIARA